MKSQCRSRKRGSVQPENPGQRLPGLSARAPEAIGFKVLSALPRIHSLLFKQK